MENMVGFKLYDVWFQAAVFKVEDDTTLLLLTASELTYQLGMSTCVIFYPKTSIKDLSF